MERKLASIQVILDLQPIPEADLIEVATVNSWKLVVKKGDYKVGDLAIYCEIDSFLPVREEFEFLRKSSFKKMVDVEGFRLKTMKMRGQISQGLLLPISFLPESMNINVGDDVTDVLGIVKFEPPIPAQLSGVMKGYFPSCIRKTDEERIQNLTNEYASFSNHLFYVTEKLDGSSSTFYLNGGDFGVCSRNIELLETEDNTLWKVATQLGIKEKLQSVSYNCALQGELIGEGIQGNPYKIKGQTVMFFNAFNIDTQKHLDYNSFRLLIDTLHLNIVPVLDNEFRLPEKIDELLEMANGKSELNASADREGLVIRSHDRTISFKVISNNFLLKEK